MLDTPHTKQRAPIRTLLAAWHRFWFSPTDPVVPSFMRMLVGGMLFYTLLVWGRNLEAFFLQSGGWQSAALVAQLQQGEWAWSFWWLVPDAWIWPVHLACLVMVLCFWLGLGTAVSKWLTFIIIISYANRVPLANYGLDQANAILTLYLCLGPCGARFSLDRLIKANLISGPDRRSVCLSSAAGLSMRMVQVHLCVIYFFAGLSKLQGMAWWNGSAVWMAASNYEYQQWTLTWLADVPWLYQGATIGTWIWEISFLFLVWNRFARPWVLAAGLSMHLGIGMFMGMWTFGLIMCFAYVAFLPAGILNSASEFLFGGAHTERRGNRIRPEDYWRESIHGNDLPDTEYAAGRPLDDPRYSTRSDISSANHQPGTAISRIE